MEQFAKSKKMSYRMKSNSKSLFAVLDAAGFVYNVRHSSAGTPYAGFRWECPPSMQLRSFTILLESEILRLTLHEALGPGCKLNEDECLSRQRDFPVTRLYNSNEQSDKVELTAAILMQGTELDIVTLKALLSHLSSNADDLLGNTTGASRQAPPLDSVNEGGSLIEILRDLGLQSSREQGAYIVDIPLPGLSVVARFSIYHLGAGWVRVCAHLKEDDSLAFMHIPPGLLNQLQIWAPVGRFVSVEMFGKNYLGCEVATPFLRRQASMIITESMQAAIQMLGTALRQVT